MSCGRGEPRDLLTVWPGIRWALDTPRAPHALVANCSILLKRVRARGQCYSYHSATLRPFYLKPRV